MMSTTVEERPVETTAKPDHFTNDVMVEKYLALRNKVADIKKAHIAQLAPYNTAMDTLEGWMLEALHSTGSQSVKTAVGTFYKTTVTSVTCHRWSDTLDFIRETEAWELLDARVNKTAAKAILEEKAQEAELKRVNGVPVDPASLTIPGVTVTTEIGLNVRKA